MHPDTAVIEGILRTAPRSRRLPASTLFASMVISLLLAPPVAGTPARMPCEYPALANNSQRVTSGSEVVIPFELGDPARVRVELDPPDIVTPPPWSLGEWRFDISLTDVNGTILRILPFVPQDAAVSPGAAFVWDFSVEPVWYLIAITPPTDPNQSPVGVSYRILIVDPEEPPRGYYGLLNIPFAGTARAGTAMTSVFRAPRETTLRLSLYLESGVSSPWALENWTMALESHVPPSNGTANRVVWNWSELNVWIPGARTERHDLGFWMPPPSSGGWTRLPTGTYSLILSAPDVPESEPQAIELSVRILDYDHGVYDCGQERAGSSQQAFPIWPVVAAGVVGALLILAILFAPRRPR